MLDRFAEMPQDWIPHQVDLLIKDGLIEEEPREKPVSVLRQNCKDSLWMRPLPETQDDDPKSNIIGRLVFALSRDLELTPEAAQKVHDKMYKTMQVMQSGLKG